MSSRASSRRRASPGSVASIMRRRWEDGGRSGGWYTAGSGVTAWSPASLGAALQGWWDASNAPSIQSSAGKVSQWNDLSGNARNLTQATGAAQPTTGSATIGGKNAVTFPTSVQNMATGFVTAQPVTIWEVVRLNQAASRADIGNTGPNAAGLFGSLVTLGSYSLYGGASQDTGITFDANAHLVVATINAGSSAFRRELTVAGAIPSVGPNAGAGFNPGGSGTGSQNFDLGEAWITNTVPSATDIYNALTYCAAKWGTLPFTPFAIPWSGAYWADDPSWAAKPANGGTLTTWRDGSPVALDLTASGSPTPTWQQSVPLLNGKGGVVVAPGGIIGIGAGAPAPAQPVSTVFLGTVDANAGASSANILSTGGGTTLSVQTGTANFGMFAGSNQFPGVGGIGAHGVRALFNGASSALNVDGGNNATSAGANADTAVRWLNSFTGATNQGGNFHIGFAGHFAGDVTTDPNWPIFRAWAASYYGLTIA